jgi:hypothetical protein
MLATDESILDNELDLSKAAQLAFPIRQTLKYAIKAQVAISWWMEKLVGSLWEFASTLTGVLAAEHRPRTHVSHA